MKTLKIGIVGCGLMGDIHAAAYRATEGLAPVAYFNRTAAKAEALAAKYGGSACTTLDELLARPDVDAVCIASPQTSHHQQILAAVRAGKHVFCEKPVALTRAELNDIQAAVAKAGVTFMTGHQMRLHPVIRAVREAMPRLGPVYQLDMEWAFRIKGHTGRCWEAYRLGGFFMELGCHATDLAQFLLGPIVNVAGTALRIDPKRLTEDTTNALLQAESGAVARILVTANHRTKRQGLLMGRLCGQNGRIEFTAYPYSRSFNQATLIIDHGKKVFVPDTDREPLPIPELPSPTSTYPGFYDVYYRQAVAFREAVAGRAKPPCDLAEGSNAVAMVLAVYHQQGQATRHPNFSNPPVEYDADGACHPLLRGAE